jgi:4-hydroxy-3-polyprenylbenzoate decarboxylase
MFNNVIGADPGLRAMGAPAATSRQPGLYLARLAMMMGHDPHATGLELVEAYVEAKSRPVRAPILVSRDKAPCKQNVMLGEDVDLTRFPVPYIHDGDGGRYIQTAGVNIVRSPDGTWTNWSVNRSMLVDKNHLTGLVIPEQHIGIVHGMWKQEGRPTPWARCRRTDASLCQRARLRQPTYRRTSRTRQMRNGQRRGAGHG